MKYTMNMMQTHNTFAAMYRAMLDDVLHNADYESAPRGKAIKERMCATYSCANPLSNYFTNAVRSIPKKYLAGELLWYFTGDNRLETISKYSGFWSGIANPDGTLNSAYGHLLFNPRDHAEFTQWQWAYDSLIKDADSRQAIMYFGGPEFQSQGNKDFVCTNNMQFFIRNNKLHAYVFMRSNDVIKGTTFDIPFFMLLQQQMWKLLKEQSYQDLELGTFTHTATSLHVYEPDFDLAFNMLKESFIDAPLPAIGQNLVNRWGNCLITENTNDDLLNWIYSNS